jgi:hypothetical protein
LVAQATDRAVSAPKVRVLGDLPWDWHVYTRPAAPASSALALCARNSDRSTDMLWTIFVILLVLWLLGMVSSYTLGGYIHILLIVAIAVVLIRVIQGRNPVA